MAMLISFGLIQSFEGLDGFTGWLLFFTVDDLAVDKKKALDMGATVVKEDPGGEHYGPWSAMKDPARRHVRALPRVVGHKKASPPNGGEGFLLG